MKTKFVQFLKGISLLCCAVSASGCTSFQKTYTITFKNYDGFILSTLTVNEGELPVYNAATPYRQKEGDFVYIFTGWNKELTNATKDEIYIAKFDATCQITWLDENNNVLESDYYKVGTMPECSIVLEDKKDTNYYYEFSEWIPSVEPVSKKTSYKASYNQYDRYYTVTWLNYDGDILEVDNNVERKSTPEYNSETPTKPSQGATTYTFDGWDKEVEPVTGNITYTALFKDNRNTHAIDFRDSDGTLIKRYLVDDGAMPFFDVALPNKNDGSDSFYIFKSWDKEIVPATEDATYKAVYTKENSYIYNANNRNSTYKIVYAGTTDSASYTAATYFQTYFKQITGKFLNIYNDSNVSSNSNTQDYISFGKTKFAQKYNFTYSDDDEFCKPDYSIINNYHVLVIDGGKFGIVYAAVELLRQMFDFDYLEPENYYFDKNLSSYCASNIVQKIFCPTIRYRQNYTAGLIRKNSMLSKMTDYGYGRGCSSDTNLFIDYSTGGRTIRNIHNALQLINKDIYKSSHPEWFSTSGNQPCMSAILKSTEAQNIIMGYYEEIAKKYPTRYLVYSLCDSYGTTTEAACNCFECEAYFHKYGNDSGLYMLLLNKLGDLIKERQAAGTIPSTVPGIMGTAYYTTSNAPFKCIDEGEPVLDGEIEIRFTKYQNINKTNID